MLVFFLYNCNYKFQYLVNNILYMGKIIFELKPLNLLGHELKNQFDPNK